MMKWTSPLLPKNRISPSDGRALAPGWLWIEPTLCVVDGSNPKFMRTLPWLERERGRM